MQQYLDNCIVIEVSLDLRVLYALEFNQKLYICILFEENKDYEN